MEINKEYLHHMYNATSTDDGKGGVESYEAWLERQLISRIKKLEESRELTNKAIIASGQFAEGIKNQISK